MQRVADDIQGYMLGGLCAANEHIRFYQRLGWKLWRGPKAIRTLDAVIETLDEDVMVLRTIWTPVLDVDVGITAEWREGELW